MLTTIFEVREELQTMYLYTRTEEVFKTTDLQSWYQEKVIDVLMNRLSTLEQGPSNSAFSEIVSLSVNRQTYQPAQVGSWIPIPKILGCRKALLNIKNDDDCCFLHCINAAVNPVKKNRPKVSGYPPLEELKLNLRNIDFPIAMKDIA